jgi:3'-phosphoadenosine 5'-phosphosulfate sulfotransferase (PAPS reductase)/FAD synthetase
MRIHPVLDFTLAQVWTFLRHPTIRYGQGAEMGGDGPKVTNHSAVPGEREGQGEVKQKGSGSSQQIIDYCLMYDQGYSSLGGVNDTLRNPRLKDDEVEGGYKPAWMMTEDDGERLGRE